VKGVKVAPRARRQTVSVVFFLGLHQGASAREDRFFVTYVVRLSLRSLRVRKANHKTQPHQRSARHSPRVPTEVTRHADHYEAASAGTPAQSNTRPQSQAPQNKNPASLSTCGVFKFWRRGWDSNPRYGKTVRLISSQVHSTTLPPLRLPFRTFVKRVVAQRRTRVYPSRQRFPSPCSQLSANICK
jgi:hypothetical protein